MTLAAFNGQVTDTAGNAITSFQVEVRHEAPGLPLAEIYSDRSGVVLLSNPFNPNPLDNGYFRFHVAGGAYRIRAFDSNGNERIWRYQAIGIAGESDDIIYFPGYLMVWDATTTEGVGVNGGIRANDANLASATELYISKLNAEGSDIEARLLELGIGDRLIITQADGSQVSFKVTVVDDETGYVKVTVTAHAGAIELSDEAATSLQLFLSSGLAAHIADPSDAHDASAISIVDAGGNYAATDVESALTEVMDALQAHEADASSAHAASAISVSPSGSMAADDVQEALLEILGDVETHVADSSAAHAASAISFSPTGGLAADDVQEALAELDTEKAAASHTHTISQITDLAGVTTHGNSDYTIQASDRTVATSATLTAARTWTLPAASAFPAGVLLHVVDLVGGVTPTNTLTVARASTDTIDGAISITIGGAYGSVTLESDGVSKWHTVAAKGVKRVTVYTSGSGTHTTMRGAVTLIAELWGGGGGSSGSGTNAGTGGDGTNTTFGSLTAGKGIGGQRGDLSGVGGAGGSASGGDVNLSGQLGGGGQNATSQPGGFGGGAPMIGIWTQGATPGAAGVAGVANTGAGAGAAGSGSTTPAGGGGGGGAFCKKMILGPATTYSYAVGPGGTAGTAGTSGFAGAAGGSGLIVVTEFTD
jgi:hypothetical protein